MADFSESTENIAGIETPVVQAGPAEASEAVLFVHGNPGSGHDWDDLAGRVGAFARAISPTMPGFGDAGKPRDFEYTIDGYARHLGALLEHLNVKRAHLVLHDFGGPWGLAWARANTEAFASAILINTGVLIDYRWHKFARIWRTPVLGEIFQATTTRAAFRQLVGRDNPKLPSDHLNRIFEQSKDWATKRAVLKLYRATPAKAMGIGADALRALDRPALVIWGSKDAYLPYVQAERQCQSFPSAKVELLEGHGHWLFWEDPERVASLVVPFLQAQFNASSASNLQSQVD